MSIITEVIERLSRHLIKHPGSGCWEWTGAKNKRGYGLLSIGGKQYFTHRLSYHYTIAPIPHGLSVLHKCDNPCCLRPDHLFVGTMADNMRDKTAKGRGTRLGQPPVLTDEDIRYAKYCIKNKLKTFTELAKLYKVSYSTIYKYTRHVFTP